MAWYRLRTRMLRSQAMLVFFSLLVLAILLHMLLCEWQYKVRHDPDIHVRIVAYHHTGSGRGFLYTGLFADYRVSAGMAIVYGIAVPLALLCVDAYLLLGWLNLAHVRRGFCQSCGYDLRGSPDGGCPECGWNRAPAKDPVESALEDSLADGEARPPTTRRSPESLAQAGRRRSDAQPE